MDSGLPSEVTDPLVFVLHMTTSKPLLNTNPTTDSEDWKSSPREILRENQRNNLKEKLKNLEVEKEEKYLLLEKPKLEPTSRRPKKITSRRLLLPDQL